MTDKTKSDEKEVLGEGNYTAARNFRKGEEKFIKAHRRDIPKMGEEAEHALDGEEGKELRAAEARAKSHSHAKAEER